MFNRLILISFLLICNSFGNCSDEANAEISKQQIITAYEGKDKELSAILVSMNKELKKTIEVEKKTLEVHEDIISLSVSGLLELKEISALVEKQRQLIFKQR